MKRKEKDKAKEIREEKEREKGKKIIGYKHPTSS